MNSSVLSLLLALATAGVIDLKWGQRFSFIEISWGRMPLRLRAFWNLGWLPPRIDYRPGLHMLHREHLHREMRQLESKCCSALSLSLSLPHDFLSFVESFERQISTSPRPTDKPRIICLHENERQQKSDWWRMRLVEMTASSEVQMRRIGSL